MSSGNYFNENNALKNSGAVFYFDSTDLIINEHNKYKSNSA